MVLNDRNPYDSDPTLSDVHVDDDEWEFVEEEPIANDGAASGGDVSSPDISQAENERSTVDNDMIDGVDVGDDGESTPNEHIFDSEDRIDSLEMEVEPGADVDDNPNTDVLDNDGDDYGMRQSTAETNTDTDADTWTPLNVEEVDEVQSQSSSNNGTAAHASPPNNAPNQQPLHRTWNIITSAFQQLDNQHQITRKTKAGLQNIGTSAQQFWSSISNETQCARTSFQSKCDQADARAREASTRIRYAASSAKDSICRANEEYRIHEKVCAGLVVGGAVLVAVGNPRAGAGALAVAGATLAAGEVMGSTSGRANYTDTRDVGLREGLHID